jgi:quinol monooxygenase YgiN
MNRGMTEGDVITILFHMTVKSGREEAFRDLAVQLTTSTHAEDAGCHAYTFHQQVNDPRQFVLYEQWEGEAALTAHLARLQVVLGPPPAPGGRLPAAFLDYLETTQATRYQVVA